MSVTCIVCTSRYTTKTKLCVAKSKVKVFQTETQFWIAERFSLHTPHATRHTPHATRHTPHNEVVWQVVWQVVCSSEGRSATLAPARRPTLTWYSHNLLCVKLCVVSLAQVRVAPRLSSLAREPQAAQKEKNLKQTIEERDDCLLINKSGEEGIEPPITGKNKYNKNFFLSNLWLQLSHCQILSCQCE